MLHSYCEIMIPNSMRRRVFVSTTYRVCISFVRTHVRSVRNNYFGGSRVVPPRDGRARVFYRFERDTFDAYLLTRREPAVSRIITTFYHISRRALFTRPEGRPGRFRPLDAGYFLIFYSNHIFKCRESVLSSTHPLRAVRGVHASYGLVTRKPYGFRSVQPVSPRHESVRCRRPSAVAL